MLRQAVNRLARAVGGGRSPAGEAPRAVALVTLFDGARLCSPLVNTLEFFAERGWQVDVYLEVGIPFDAGVGHPRVRLIRMPRGRWVSVELENMVRFRQPPQPYAFAIGFDPAGLIRATVLAAAWRVPVINHSLEIRPESAATSWRLSLRAKLQKLGERAAICTLTQDDARADVLARHLGVPREDVLVSYNSSRGEPLPEKLDRFREWFPIPEGERIVLLTGSLQWQHCILPLVEAAADWPAGWTLVVHGWFCDDAYQEQVTRAVKALGARACLSTRLLPADRRHELFQSADVGLVFFEVFDENTRTSIGSAGKLYDCMRAGVPVIARDLPGARALLEDNGVGRVVGSPADVGQALQTIGPELDALRARALEVFPRYSFTRCYEGLLPELERRAAQ